MAKNGEIGLVGTRADGGSTLDANALFATGATLRAVAAGSRTQLERVLRTYAVNKLRPVVSRVFGFDAARSALAHYAEAQDFGKIVIKLAA